MPLDVDEAQGSTGLAFAVVFGVTAAVLSPVPVGGTTLAQVPGGIALGARRADGQRLSGWRGSVLWECSLGPVVTVFALALLT